MKFLTRALLFLALTGAGSFLLAELVNPLRNADEAKTRATDLPPMTLAAQPPVEAPAAVADAVPQAEPSAPAEMAVVDENADGKEVLDAKDYKEAIGEGKEAIGEGPGRIAGPGSLAPGPVPLAIRGRPPELPPDTVLVTPN